MSTKRAREMCIFQYFVGIYKIFELIFSKSHNELDDAKDYNLFNKSTEVIFH